MEGYIKIFRKMLEWEWYDDTNTKVVFLHCLLKANFADKNWRGITIQRGQFLTSVATLSNELDISGMQVRTALNKLQGTNEITIQTTNKYSIITVCNYDSYQVSDDTEYQAKQQAEGQTDIKQVTNKQQTNNNNVKRKEGNNTRIQEEDIKNTTTNVDSVKKTSQGFDIKGYLKEKGVSTQHINEWLQVRKVKKGVNTLTAMENIDKEIIKAGITWDEAVTYCIIHNWVGFKAEWYNREGRSGVPAPFQNIHIHPGNVEERDRDVPLLEGNIPGVDYEYIKRLRDEQERKGKLKPKD